MAYVEELLSGEFETVLAKVREVMARDDLGMHALTEHPAFVKWLSNNRRRIGEWSAATHN
jgi:hypothetical protein